jgi:hypothetical protein
VKPWKTHWKKVKDEGAVQLQGGHFGVVVENCVERWLVTRPWDVAIHGQYLGRLGAIRPGSFLAKKVESVAVSVALFLKRPFRSTLSW